MCFTPEFSMTFASIMAGCGLFWTTLPGVARVTMIYFATMEALQAWQYQYIDECDSWMNQVLTYAGLIHLVFQPLFVNLYLSAFMTKAQKKYVPLILGMCALAGVNMANRFWMTKGDIMCDIGTEPMCGPVNACTFKGDFHLAWQLPMQHADQDYFTPGFQLHFFMFFLPTFLLGMWPTTIFLLASGPIIGRLMTKHQDEIPAIWCIYSIVQVMGPLIHTLIRGLPLPLSKAPIMGGKRPKAIKGEDEGEEPLDSYWTVAKRTIIFAIALTVKRYVTIYMNEGAAPDLVHSVANPAAKLAQ